MEERHAPFLHAIFANALRLAAADEFLKLLEQSNWEERTGPFYKFAVPTDEALRVDVERRIKCELPFDRLRARFEQIFDCRLREGFRVELHRYGEGDGIGPHTDFGTPEIRMVLHVNRNWCKENGGVWVLAGDSALQDLPSYLPSLSNTGFAFSTGMCSFHALSRCSSCVLYGIVVRMPRD